jgi:hypothetical protein
MANRDMSLSPMKGPRLKKSFAKANAALALLQAVSQLRETLRIIEIHTRLQIGSYQGIANTIV